jgi:regulator of replication initiation timing
VSWVRHVKQAKALEEENEKLGAENEQLTEKLAEQCKISAVGAEEAEESMTVRIIPSYIAITTLSYYYESD